MLNTITGKQEAQHDKYPSRCGQLYALICSVAYGFFLLSNKLLRTRHPVAYANYYGAFPVCFSIYLLSLKLKVPLFRGDSYIIQSKLFLRGMCGAFTFLCITVATVYIPIQLIAVLQATNTFWGLIFDTFVNRIKLTTTMVIMAFLTFIGVVFVVNPEFILSHFGIEYTEPEDTSKNFYVKDYVYYLGVFIASMAAFGGVLINYMMAELARSVHPCQNAFYAILPCVYLGAALTFCSEEDGPWLIQDYLYLFVYYLCFCIHYSAIFFANKQEKRQSYISIFVNFSVIWNFIQAYVVFNDVIYISNIIGAVLVVVCGFLVLQSKEKAMVMDTNQKIIQTTVDKN